ncbi:hypothetical protein B0H14DRAFT_1566847 [Mycena olivaceomarginata]|nr:hypothetical protein B0H14DRAFT_1566847 [Mycena olivaceomarginata]
MLAFPVASGSSSAALARARGHLCVWLRKTLKKRRLGRECAEERREYAVLGREYAVAGLEYAVAEREYAAFLWMQASHLALWRLGRSWAAEQQCHAELQARRYARAAPRRYRCSLQRLRVCPSVLMYTELQTPSRCYLLQPRAPGWQHLRGPPCAPA